MDITSLSLKLKNVLFPILKNTYQSRKIKRAELFFQYVDLRYDVMSIEEKKEFQIYVNSELGKDILANFADSITQTSSQIAVMALALLYCRDSDFDYSESEIYRFVSAMNGITDDLLNFYLEIVKLNSDEYMPYNRSEIHNQNAHQILSEEWDVETLSIYINDLTRRYLILPDPKTSAFGYAGNANDWSFGFGVTDRVLKMASLVRKAKNMIE